LDLTNELGLIARVYKATDRLYTYIKMQNPLEDLKKAKSRKEELICKLSLDEKDKYIASFQDSVY
jgi:hypothetical protein